MDNISLLKADLEKGFTKKDLEVLIGLPKNSLSAIIAGHKRLSKKSGLKVINFMKGEKPDPLTYDNRTNPLINSARGRDEIGVNEDELQNKTNRGKNKGIPTNGTQNENKGSNGAKNASQIEIPTMPVREDFEEGFNGSANYAFAKNEWKRKYNQ